MKIESSNKSTGLFAYIGTGGKVANLKLVNADITGGSSTGAIAGTSTGTIENVDVEGKVTGGTIRGNCRSLHGGTLQNSKIHADIQGNTVGGLIGSTNYNASGSALTVKDEKTGNIILNNYVMVRSQVEMIISVPLLGIWAVFRCSAPNLYWQYCGQ